MNEDYEKRIAELEKQVAKLTELLNDKIAFTQLQDALKDLQYS